jgi:hypothetical protein
VESWAWSNPHNGSGSALSRIAPAPLLPVRKPPLTVFRQRAGAFMKYFRLTPKLALFGV